MIAIHCRNVNDAFHEVMWKLPIYGDKEETRNGEVISVAVPFAITYERPWERMLYSEARDANPFFHIAEGLWMLAGRNDVESVSYFAKRLATFSDDGDTLHGAYGFRWREHFGVDQLDWVIKHLKETPNSRRAVVQMWDAAVDPTVVDGNGLDVPCNTAIYFRIVGNRLNMTVCNRSNDAVWGALGANVVHMSMLHEFVACALGIEMGDYVQISNNLHIYQRHFDLLKPVEPALHGAYDMGYEHISLTDESSYTLFLQEVERLFESGDYKHPSMTYSSPYLNRVALPMMEAYRLYKEKQKEQAFRHVKQIEDLAVQRACSEWLSRRNWEQA